MMKITSFSGGEGFILEGVIGPHRTVELQLFQHQWLGHNLDDGVVESFALEMNQDYSVIFEIAHKHYILGSLDDSEGYFIPSKGFSPTGVDRMVIRNKFTHSCPFWFTDS